MGPLFAIPPISAWPGARLEARGGQRALGGILPDKRRTKGAASPGRKNGFLCCMPEKAFCPVCTALSTIHGVRKLYWEVLWSAVITAAGIVSQEKLMPFSQEQFPVRLDAFGRQEEMPGGRCA